MTGIIYKAIAVPTALLVMSQYAAITQGFVEDAADLVDRSLESALAGTLDAGTCNAEARALCGQFVERVGDLEYVVFGLLPGAER